MSQSDVLAIVCSDVHLSHTPPIYRSAEPDWYAAQDRVLGQLRAAQTKYGVPVVIAGDVFDRWNVPPELINFAIESLPDCCYAIPGQHDLPSHRYDLMHRSGYGTLRAAGVIQDLREPTRVGPRLVLFPFPWGFDVQGPGTWSPSKSVLLAVVHAYIWRPGFAFPGAREECRLPAYLPHLDGYDAAVFGDNHKPFTSSKTVNVMNCGTLMVRKSDDVREPTYGLLRGDGTFEVCVVDTSQDVYSESVDLPEVHCDVSGFLDELQELGGDSLDFRQVVESRLDELPAEVRSVVVELLDG